MLFSSITFLYYFLPVTAVVYFLSPKRGKNTILFLCSLFFYAWGEPKYIILMGITILQGYWFGLCIERYRTGKASRFFFICSVGISLSLLLYFKYIPFLQVSLPIGISFYTFQMISYTTDVYRGEMAQKNIINLAAYITMFPQLVAGPIVRYSDILDRLKNREHTWEGAAEGIRRFVIGLAKKVLLADQLGELGSVFLASQEKSVLFYWLYAVGAALQIYFDFSGYSDMAVGLGRIFGFRFPENFHYPFISGSITEFWRRWHISLGSWFRDYVYIPLGGSRRGKKRQLCNILIVWTLTGLWHGAAWNFVLWGLLFAVLLAVEKVWLLQALKKNRVLSHIYVLFFVLISFVIFHTSDPVRVFSDIGGLFGAGGIPLVSKEAWYCMRSFAGVLLAAAAGSTPVFRIIVKKAMEKPFLGKMLHVAEPVFVAALMITVTAYLVDGSFHPFLYFRF